MNEIATFSDIYENIRDMEPGELVSQLSRVFANITKLNEDQAIAAYQTITVLEEASGNTGGAIVIRHMKAAIETRMTVIVSRSPFTHERRRTKECFSAAGYEVDLPDFPY